MLYPSGTCSTSPAAGASGLLVASLSACAAVQLEEAHARLGRPALSRVFVRDAAVPRGAGVEAEAPAATSSGAGEPRGDEAAGTSAAGASPGSVGPGELDQSCSRAAPAFTSKQRPPRAHATPEMSIRFTALHPELPLVRCGVLYLAEGEDFYEFTAADYARIMASRKEGAPSCRSCTRKTCAWSCVAAAHGLGDQSASAAGSHAAKPLFGDQQSLPSGSFCWFETCEGSYTPAMRLWALLFHFLCSAVEIYLKPRKFREKELEEKRSRIRKVRGWQSFVLGLLVQGLLLARLLLMWCHLLTVRLAFLKQSLLQDPCCGIGALFPFLPARCCCCNAQAP